MRRKIAFNIGELVQHKLSLEVGMVVAYTVRDIGCSYEVEWANRNNSWHTERVLQKNRPRIVIGLTDQVYESVQEQTDG